MNVWKNLLSQNDAEENAKKQKNAEAKKLKDGHTTMGDVSHSTTFVREIKITLRAK